jgi:hypothetical protein
VQQRPQLLQAIHQAWPSQQRLLDPAAVLKHAAATNLLFQPELAVRLTMLLSQVRPRWLLLPNTQKQQEEELLKNVLAADAAFQVVTMTGQTKKHTFDRVSVCANSLLQAAAAARATALQPVPGVATGCCSSEFDSGGSRTTSTAAGSSTAGGSAAWLSSCQWHCRQRPHAARCCHNTAAAT